MPYALALALALTLAAAVAVSRQLRRRKLDRLKLSGGRKSLAHNLLERGR